MESLNGTERFLVERNYISDDLARIQTEKIDQPNWLESLLRKLENKLGISSSHGVVIFMMLYLIILLSTTFCVLCCYSCILNRRRTQTCSKNKAGGSNYFKNIQSFYSATAEDIDDPENAQNEPSSDSDPSSIPSHLIKDVLMQEDEVSNLAESTVNDDELQAYDQEISDYSSNDSFHVDFHDGESSHYERKSEKKIPSSFEGFDRHERISYPRKDWVKFDDDPPSYSLNDSDLDVLEEELEVEKRQQLNEDHWLLPSSKKRSDSINLGSENDGDLDPQILPPLNFSAIVASQVPN